MEKLFEAQKGLRSVIFERFPDLSEKDNLDWLVLSLQVELGELANEQRSWKMWSENRQPRTSKEVFCKTCNGTGTPTGIPEESGVDCWKCGGAGSYFKNPLLEEYADCLSFILEIGLEIESEQNMPIESFNYYPVNIHKHLTISETFSSFIIDAGKLGNEEYNTSYVMYLCCFLGFGETLGFTVDEIIEAYYEKNKVNHMRQESGY